ncbi:hypothetical protein PoB_007097600 [Plakobranchus ocellatus]|uniref:DUF3456 domain-containing protein n=1 Tax=Plakobranchus ocellatus TaxID=259542 RepID=A0AAV4DKH6_9GAST|nr:hypothetical protein PoB_007097600 [Plakobranchus ocellatus]
MTSVLLFSLVISLSNLAFAKKAKGNQCKICNDITKNFYKGLESTAKSNYGGGNTKWEEKSLGSYATSEVRLVEIIEKLCDDASKEGLESTAKSNYGGGNTKWEEKSLGSYATSEVRLVEIIEKLCDDASKECHSLLEEHEEIVERFWMNMKGTGMTPNIVSQSIANQEIIMVKIAVPYESRMEEADKYKTKNIRFLRKRLEKAGYKSQVLSVEAGARGFVRTSAMYLSQQCPDQSREKNQGS